MTILIITGGCLKTRHPLFVYSREFDFGQASIFLFIAKYLVLWRPKSKKQVKTAIFRVITIVLVRFFYFSCHFLDVKGYGEEGKVHCNFVFAEVSEAFVVHIGFHLSEYGFRFDATPPSMSESFF